MRDARPRPYWLVAELTYRCPLQCPYCTNPLELHQHANELETSSWMDVLSQARELGSVQLGLSGGEPLVRKDLEQIVRHAHDIGFYSNLITTGIGLTEKRVKNLKDCGLDHIQLSIQDKAKTPTAFFDHTRTMSHKKQVAQWIKDHDYPMVANIVLHRHNLDHIETLIQSAIEIGADSIELANAQYHGWAFKNRHHLIPTQEQLVTSEAIASQYQKRYKGKVDIFYVVPDYHEGSPKPCMCGWGNISLTVSPNGQALPCLSAGILPGIDLPSVKEKDLDWIWYESSAFNLYRGEDWMLEPCKSCPQRSVDFGGCRCQAFLLTGHATNAEPVCEKSEHNSIVIDAVERANCHSQRVDPMLFRNMANSRQIIAKG